MWFDNKLLRAPLVARNPNLQVVITHASRVCSQHSFGHPLILVPRATTWPRNDGLRGREWLSLRMFGMHITQLDHARLNLLSLVIWSRVFWRSVTWNLCKAQRFSESVFTFDRWRPHSVTFGYLILVLNTLTRVTQFCKAPFFVLAWNATGGMAPPDIRNEIKPKSSYNLTPIVVCYWSHPKAFFVHGIVYPLNCTTPKKHLFREV